MLFFVHRITIVGCHFRNNTGTALFLGNSTITVNESLTFGNNNAHDGAAIYISGPSVVKAYKTTAIIFKGNHATHNGGGIYIDYGSINEAVYTLDSGFLPLYQPCFISVENYVYKLYADTHILFFEDNVADDGGCDIFGGNLGLVFYQDTSKRCMTAVQELSQMNSTVSAVSSSPSRVCFCDKNSSTANCLKYMDDVYIFPGDTFSVNAYTVGQHFGTSRGNVYAQILNKSSNSSIGSEQKVQTVDIWNCSGRKNTLTYRVRLSHFKDTETIVLTTEDVMVSNLVNESEIDSAIKEYEQVNKSYVPLVLLKLPVYIKVHFSMCPSGFDIVGGVCNCTHIFRGHFGKYSVTCDIGKQEIARQFTVWVDSYNNVTRYSQYCPLLYCNSSAVWVDLSKKDGSDAQCINHHSGVLCGGCQKGFSLAIGSSNCLPHCSNSYLWFLLVFCSAGVLLVLFIKYLNLTITQGMINGLIFYANIVQTNKDSLLSSNEPGVRVLATFIAWLNLDSGIETCFFKDLDMYTKTWLQFVFPLYLWTLAGGIILACRYSTLTTKCFGNNAVQVLATIIILSYNKLFIVITTVYSSSTINFENNVSQTVHDDLVWTYDGNVTFFGFRHLALFAVSTAVLLFLWLPFTLCVLLGQWLQRYNHYRGLRWVGRIQPFLDAYYGPLKGNRRYWIGVLLLARVVVVIPASDPHSPAAASNLAIIILCSLLLLSTIWLGGVYKSLHLTLLESIFITNLGLFAALSLYLNDINRSQAIAAYAMVGMIFFIFSCILVYQIVQTVSSGCHRRRKNYSHLQSSTEERVNEE